MNIFIMRHGEAAHFASSDAQRELTETGKQASKLMASWLSTQVNQLDMVLVSPYIRAQQTWESCSALLPLPQKVLTENGITPYGDSDDVATYIKALITNENLSSMLIISHLPLVGYLCHELDPSVAPPSFPTSAICQLEFDANTQLANVVQLKTPQD